MSKEVYADGNEIACKAGDGKVIAAFPDVCLSPPSPPAGPIPVPYPDTSFSKDMQDGSTTVKIGDDEVMLKDKSFYKTSPLGNEAATNSFGAAVVTHVITGKTYFTAWSMDVKFEGQNVDRHIDITTSNHASEPGNTPPLPNAEGMAVAGGDDEDDEVLCECCGEPAHSAAQANGDEISEAEFYGGSPDGAAWLDLARNADGGKCAHLAPPAPPTDDPCAKYYRNTAPENRAAREAFGQAGANPLSNPNSLPHVFGQGQLAHQVPLCGGGCPIGQGNLAPVGADPDCQYLEGISGNIQSQCAGR